MVWCMYIRAKARTKEVGTKGRGTHVATLARPAARPWLTSPSSSPSLLPSFTAQSVGALLADLFPTLLATDQW